MTKQKVKRYCVWETKTDNIVAIDMTAKECARVMEITTSTFYIHATVRNFQKYTIYETEVLERMKTA